MSDARDAYFADRGAGRGLYIKPAFYDSLSGEFRYSRDSEDRTHTLGRLAQATFNKGVIDRQEEECEPPYLIARYSPSWAPQAELLVDYDEVEDGMNIAHGLWLRPVGALSGGIYIDESNDVLQIGSSAEEKYYSLELGRKLTIARQAVTEVAREFFDSTQ